MSDNATAAEEALEELETAVYWKYSLAYPQDLWYMCTSVIGFAILLNIFSIYWAWSRRHELRRGALSQPSSSEKKVLDSEKATAERVRKAEWRHVPDALFAASRIIGLRMRVPHIPMTILEIFLTFVYLLAVFLFNFLNAWNLDIGFVESRAADIATAQFPLIFFLAMKNNVIQFLTGISHEKLNLMHRVTSRVMLLAIWIHWWGCVVRGTNMFEETWIWMGTMSAMAQTVLTITAIKWVRQKWYEFFFMTHVIGVVLFLIGALWHVIYLEEYWQNYLWPCVAIWGQDRVCRYIRYLILSNFHPPNKNPAHVELLSEDTIRITVRRTFNLPLNVGKSWADSFGWKAGQHLFLAFPTIGPIESHPFTIASVCEPLDDDETGKEREFMWIVRARSGFTRRLKEHVASKKGVCDIPIFMDGPYGAPADITGFDTCVFVAGGSGVAYTIPRMRDILNKVAKGEACAKRVVFIWAIRDPAHINWISKDLMKSVSTLPPGVDLSIQIYITSRPPSKTSPEKLKCLPSLTSAASADDSPISSPVTPMSPTPTVVGGTTESTSQAVTRTCSSSKSSTDDDTDNASTSTHTATYEVDWDIKGVDVSFGRPDMHTLLEDVVTSTSGHVSVDLSGPEGLVASVRSALSSSFAGPMNVLRGGARVQLNVEDFTM